ncbi:hypothetical protein QQ045_017007 [Rhodiola kirilowii]
MAAESTKIQKLYRLLLKAMKKHYGVEDYNKHFKPFVTMEFRKDASHLDRRIQLAKDYIVQLNKSTFEFMHEDFATKTRPAPRSDISLS